MPLMPASSSSSSLDQLCKSVYSSRVWARRDFRRAELRWCVLKQDSQVGFRRRGLDGGWGVEEEVLLLLPVVVLESEETWVGQVGER